MKPKTIWVCGACGKYADTRDGLRDVSCYMWGIECELESVKFDENGQIIAAKAIKKEAE